MDEITPPTDATTKPIELTTEPVQSEVVLEPIPEVVVDATVQADAALPTVEPAAQHVEVVPADLPTIEAGQPTPPQVEERIVEKVIEKEVIREVIKEVPVDRVVERVVEKVNSGEGEPAGGPRAQDSLRSFPRSNEWTAPVKEVPVDRIVEKIVYRDGPPRELTDAELAAIKHDWLAEMAQRGAAKKHENMKSDLDHILELFDTKPEIHNKDVMEALSVVSATATKYLHILTESGKIKMAGAPHGGPTTHYSRI